MQMMKLTSRALTAPLQSHLQLVDAQLSALHEQVNRGHGKQPAGRSSEPSFTAPRCQ